MFVGVGSCARWSAGVAGGVGAASVAAVGVAFLEYVQMRAERVKASSEMDDLTWMMLREGAGEGLVMEYHRAVLFSLPLVFLVYATIALGTAFLLFYTRDASVSGMYVRSVVDRARWAVLGVVGGVGTVMVGSWLL